jgi:hypothetical protein
LGGRAPLGADAFEIAAQQGVSVDILLLAKMLLQSVPRSIVCDTEQYVALESGYIVQCFGYVDCPALLSSP